MRILKNLVFIVLTSLLCYSCKNQNPSTGDVVLGSSMRVEWKIDNATLAQVDSLVMAESLPSFSRWLGGTFSDFETGEKTTKRMYIKKVSDSKEIVFIIIGNSEPFEVIKRVEER